MGPKGLRPARLVLSAIPRSVRTILVLWKLEQAKVIYSIAGKVAKTQYRRKLESGLQHTKGPHRIEHSLNLPRLSMSSLVLVSRPLSQRWKGLFNLIHIEGETVLFQMDHRRIIFRFSFVKPFIKP